MYGIANYPNPLGQRVDPFQQACVKLKAYGYTVYSLDIPGLYDVVLLPETPQSVIDAYFVDKRQSAYELTTGQLISFAGSL